MSHKLGYALIGCGGCGVGKHLASYSKLTDDIAILGVYDSNPQKAAAVAVEHAIQKVYATPKELFADPRIDIVSIATTNLSHAPLAVAALESGKHVHIEKPMAINAIAAKNIVDAEAKSGKKVLVGVNNRFSEAALYAKRYVDKGALGEIYHARCGWRRRIGTDVFGSWFANQEQSGGGPLIDLGVHFIDLTMHMLGYPAPEAVCAATYDKIAQSPMGGEANVRLLGRDKAKGSYSVEDIAVGFIRLTGGATISFEVSWASHTEEEVNYMELLGSKGGLTIRNNKLKIYGEIEREPVDISPILPPDTGWGEAETRHFVDCIRNDSTPYATAEEAVKMLQIVDAVYASARTAREVVIES